MNVAIIGCGAIGEKRLNSLDEHTLLYAVDKDIKRAERLCSIKNQGKALCDYYDVMSDDKVDVVVVATTNDVLADITSDALMRGKHVLVEKPAGRNPEELNRVLEIAKESKGFAKVGLNHRFHPALLKAKQIIDTGEIGDIMFIRGRYGHGGRIGYEKEWRFIKAISGGGELIDQGVHLIDLARWFLNSEFTSIAGSAETYFWDTNLDDNGFMHLKTGKNQTAWLHVSATEWKNIFCMEVYGKNAKLQIDGLGGSYGIERLTYYKMKPEMGPPETAIWEYPFQDDSWNLEFRYFIDCIERNEQPDGNLYDIKQAVDIVYKIYAKQNMGVEDI